MAATLADIESLIAGLTSAGYRPTVLQQAQIVNVLGPAPERAAAVLPPILARTGAEQRDLRQLGMSWSRRHAPPEREANAAAEIVTPEGPRRRRRRERLIILVAVFALPLILITALEMAGEPAGRPPLSAVDRAPSLETLTKPAPFTVEFSIDRRRIDNPNTPLIRTAIAATPLTLLAGWLVWRWRRRRLWATQGAARNRRDIGEALEEPLAPDIFAPPGFDDVARALRRPVRSPDRRLDIDRSIEATANAAGLFQPVYGARRVTPTYLFLLEKLTTGDHLPILMMRAVFRLRRLGLDVEAYFFRDDPKTLEGADRPGEFTSLDAVLRGGARRLAIVGGADGLFHPLTGDLHGWARQLRQTPERAVLSVRPIVHWTERELKLLDAGFALATAEPAGFAAYAGFVGQERRQAGRMRQQDLLLQGRLEPVGLTPFTVFQDGPEFPKMVALSGGRFLMGSPEDEASRQENESPRHEVAISAFAIGVYPVTFAEFDAFCAATNRERPDDVGWGRGLRPVINVSWEDAQEYVTWLSLRTGNEYRLPSESEWEYAARGGTATPFWFGATIDPSIANYDGRYTYDGGPKGVFREQTTPVGTVGGSNAYGLCDVHGNVWEWVEDVYAESYVGASTDGSPRVSGKQTDGSSSRVLRGGSWDSNPWDLRSASRGRLSPEGRINLIGFRVARTLP